MAFSRISKTSEDLLSKSLKTSSCVNAVLPADLFILQVNFFYFISNNHVEFECIFIY